MIAMPDIDNITHAMTGFVQLEFNGDMEAKEAARELRKKIVRYCLLSWTMCMASISMPLKEKFKDDEQFKDKRLITEKELAALKVIDKYPGLADCGYCRVGDRTPGRTNGGYL